MAWKLLFGLLEKLDSLQFRCDHLWELIELRSPGSRCCVFVTDRCRYLPVSSVCPPCSLSFVGPGWFNGLSARFLKNDQDFFFCCLWMNFKLFSLFGQMFKNFVTLGFNTFCSLFSSNTFYFMEVRIFVLGVCICNSQNKTFCNNRLRMRFVSRNIPRQYLNNF